MLFYAAASAGLVTLIKPIMDSVLSRRLDLTFWGVPVDLRSWSVAVLAIYLFKGLGAYFSTYLMTDVGQRVVRDLRDELFRHILDQSAGFFSRRTSGQLMSRITNDVSRSSRRCPRRSATSCARRSRVVGFACADVLLRRAAGARRGHRRAARRLSAGAARPARAPHDPARARKSSSTCRTSRSRPSPATASSRRSAPRRTRRRGFSGPRSACIAPTSR